MSVLIKGMRMPPKGMAQTIMITVSGEVKDIYSEEVFEVIEVPEPHGRLIDADELGELIHRMWVARRLTNTKYNTFNGLLDIAKTVIEAEGE